MLDHEIADPDRADLAVSKQGLQGAVGLQGPVERRRQRLMQDQQVDVFDAELADALLEGVQRLVVSVVADPNLGLQEDLRSVQIRGVHRLGDLALVAVGRRRVDVAIAVAKGDSDGVGGFVKWRLVHAETEPRHLDPIIEGDGFHLSTFLLWLDAKLGSALKLPQAGTPDPMANGDHPTDNPRMDQSGPSRARGSQGTASLAAEIASASVAYSLTE